MRDRNGEQATVFSTRRDLKVVKGKENECDGR